MKFIVILALAFCAVTVNSSPHIERKLVDLPVAYQLDFISQDGIVDGLIQIIQNLIIKAQELLQEILNKLESILHGINNTIQKIIDESKAFVDRIFNATLERLEEIAKKDELSRQCVENSRPDLHVAITDYGFEIETCRTNAVEQTQNISSEIQPHIEAIRKNIRSLEDIVNDCLETTLNPLKLIVCIANRTNDIKTELLEMITNAKNAITTAPTRVIEIIQETNTCVSVSNEKFSIAIENIINNVNQCIEDGNVKPEPEPELLRSKFIN